MRKRKGIWLVFLLLTALVLSGNNPSQAISIEDITVLKISPQDARAVIKISGGDMQIIKAGDEIFENIKVMSITEGRIVVEEMTENGAEKVIIQVDNGKQKIMRIRKVEGGKPFLYVPHVLDASDASSESSSFSPAENKGKE